MLCEVFPDLSCLLNILRREVPGIGNVREFFENGLKQRLDFQMRPQPNKPIQEDGEQETLRVVCDNVEPRLERGKEIGRRGNVFDFLEFHNWFILP